MNIKILNKNKVPTPAINTAYPFIDKQDNLFKIKKSDGTIISFVDQNNIIATTAEASDILQGKYAVLNGILTEGTLENKGTVTITPSISDSQYTKGVYNLITVKGDASLISENIKKGITIFGISGSYEGQSFDFSAATSDFGQYLLTGHRAYNKFGSLEEGYMEMLPDKVAIFNTIEELDGSNANIKRLNYNTGYVSSNAYIEINGLSEVKPENIKKDISIAGVIGTYEGESSNNLAVLEFYECTNVTTAGGSNGIKITGSTGQDGIYLLEDESAAGSARIYKSDNGYNFQYKDMGAPGYRWVLVQTDTSNVYAICTSSTSANITVEEICNNLSWEEWYNTDPVAEVYTTAGDASWSGYKMTWSEGEAGTDIIVTNFKSFTDDNPLILKTDDGKKWYHYFNGENNLDGGYYIEHSEEAVYGHTGWQFFQLGGSDEWYYANSTAPANASITEICVGQWVASDYGSSSSIPTFTPSVSPAGWVKADTPTEGLTVKGYIPKAGTIYSADTTIEVKRMFDGNTWDYVVYAPLAASSTVTDTGQAITDIGSPTFGTIANVDCAIFSGSDGIKIPDADIITSGDISICMKVYFNSFNEGALFHIGTASANDLMLFPNGSGSKWSLGTAGGVGNILSVTDTITTNTWMSIAVIKSGSTLKFYHDGNMIYENEWSITINKNGFIRIGCGYYNGNDTWFFDGSVAEFMVFNRALGASEVSQLAQQ